MIQSPVCLLHIGKTGGSFLKSVLNHNKDRLPENLVLHGHEATLRKTRKRFGPERKLAFVFREPGARFVSAFNSRLRQGRPTYQSAWRPEEAAAFLWFKTPSELAEALESPDERLKSAAFFAMESISHLARNYQFYLAGVKALQKEEANIVMCIDLADLNANLAQVLATLGVENAEIPQDSRTHAAPPSAVSVLSPEGEAALRSYWGAEYRIYDHCRSIARF
jgi:hypothetical protein